MSQHGLYTASFSHIQLMENSLSTPHLPCSKAEEPHKWLIGIFDKWEIVNNAARAYAMWLKNTMMHIFQLFT